MLCRIFRDCVPETRGMCSRHEIVFVTCDVPRQFSSSCIDGHVSEATKTDFDLVTDSLFCSRIGYLCHESRHISLQDVVASKAPFLHLIEGIFGSDRVYRFSRHTTS